MDSTYNNIFTVFKMMLIWKKKRIFAAAETSPIVMLEMESQKWFRLSSLSLKDPLWRIGTTPAFVVPVFKAMEGRSCRSVGEKLIFLGHDFRYFLSWTNECKVEKILKGILDSITSTFSEDLNYGLENIARSCQQTWKQKVCWHQPAMFCLTSSRKLSRQ